MTVKTVFKDKIQDFPQLVVNGTNINEETFLGTERANEIIADYAGFGTADDEPLSIHRGIDFAADQGQKAYTFIDGTVKEIGDNFLSLEDQSGTFWVYGNIDPFEYKVGEAIKAGDKIGILSSKKEAAKDIEGADSIEENRLHIETQSNPVGDDVSRILLNKDEGNERQIKLETSNPVAELENTINIKEHKDSIFDRAEPFEYTIQSSTDPSNARSLGVIRGNVYDNSESEIKVRDVSIVAYPSGKEIDPNAETWVISHGWDDNPNSKNFQDLAKTISSKGKQVLLLDWSEAAATGAKPSKDYISGPKEAANWISDVAGFASDALTNIWGISSDNLNLIGHSLGAYVSSQIGNQISGGVNKIVALDPATTASKTTSDFTVDVNNNKDGKQNPDNFSDAAKFSRAFWGDPSRGNGAGSSLRAQTANESFEVSFLEGNPASNHGNIVKLYDSLIEESAKINDKFKLDDLGGKTNFGNLGASQDSGIFQDTFTDPVRPNILKFGDEFNIPQTISNDSDVTQASIDGTSGNDEITGTEANDRIVGGAGNDRLTGGSGQDTFAGSPKELDGDTITDFRKGDKAEFLGVSFSRSDLTIESGSAILAADTNSDGEVDSRVTLEGEDITPDRSFAVTSSGGSTIVGLELSGLGDKPFSKFNLKGGDPSQLTSAILADGSSINVVSDSINLSPDSVPQEIGEDDDEEQTGSPESPTAFYDGSLEQLEIGKGILLTSGDGSPPLENTSPSYSFNLDRQGDSDLDKVANQAFSGSGETFDANTLQFNFTVDDPDVKTVKLDLAFASDEFPEFSDTSFVDSAGVFVNGENIALFNENSNQPLSIISENLEAGNFMDNESGSTPQNFTGSTKDLPVEYDGVSSPLTVQAPVQEGENTIKIGVADTGDRIYDSGLFVSQLSTSQTTSGDGGVLLNISGSDGDDNTAGSEQNEFISTGAGNDSIDPVGGNNVIESGEGDDTIQGGKGDNQINGGPGEDTVTYDKPQSDLTISTLLNGNLQVGSNTDELQNVEQLKFSDGQVSVESVKFNFDIDNNGSSDALSDGILTVRHLFDFQGQALTQGAIGPGANQSQAAEIASYLESGSQILDVDNNGETDALTDGILLTRYLFGFSGEALTQGAIGEGALRSSPEAIASYLDKFTPSGSSAVQAEDLSAQIPELQARPSGSQLAQSNRTADQSLGTEHSLQPEPTPSSDSLTAIA